MDKLEDKWNLLEKRLNNILDKYDTTLEKFDTVDAKNDKYVKIMNKICIGELIMAIAMLIIAIVK